MALRSFIVANPAAAALLLLISGSLTLSSGVVASPFDNSELDNATSTESSLLTRVEVNEEIIHSGIESEKDSDRMTDTPLVTTTGTCKAILPDGRLQTVVYTCAPTGYSAVVQYHKAGNQSATPTATSPAVANPATQQQQQQILQPITEILFRPTIDSSSRVTTETEKTAESITTTVAPAPSLSTKKTKSESMAPHRFHVLGGDEKVRTVSLVQLQHSLPSLPLSTSSSSSTSTTPATTKGRRRSTTVASTEEVASSTTPAAIIRRRKTRLNIPTEGGTILQSEPLP